MSAPPPHHWPERPPDRLEQRITVERDGTIVARSGKVEFGQGIRTGFAKMVAEELGVPLEKVRVELGETERVPWDMGTFGSMSTSVDGKLLRTAAIFARKQLIERAAAHFGAPASQLSIGGGSVSARDGRSVSYQDLTEREPLTGNVPPAETSGLDFPAPVDSPFRLEALSIVTGTTRYASDVRLPKMLRGFVLHAPVHGNKVRAVDDRSAKELPGVVAIVRGEDFVGVVAEKAIQAIVAARALRIEWERPATAPEAPFEVALRGDEGVAAALAASPRQFSAEYHVPHISHTPIGPSAGVADVREDGADLYVSTQQPFGLRDQAARILGVSPGKVRVHPQMMSGVYGRGNMNDAAIEAVWLSRAVKRPVMVQWSREEEFRAGPQRPILEAKIDAALDAGGMIAAWRYRERTNPHVHAVDGPLPPGLIALTCGSNAVPPYRLGRAEVLLRVEPASIRTGDFRSLAAAPNVFAIESFMDELARGSGQDPVEFRLRHIEDERLRRVVTAVRERSGWDQRKREYGRGFGFASTIFHDTYTAEVAEVTVEENGQIHVGQVWCVADPGRLVHPDGARNQLEGGIQQAASWTLYEEIQARDGEVTNASFQDYHIATFREAVREIDASFVPAQEFPSSGIGEAGSVPAAAAIANAVFDACGVRMRRLPLTQQAVIQKAISDS